MMYGGDLDGDGDLDIVATRNREAKITFAFNDGTGGFDSTTVKAAGTWPLAAWCGDLDGDGDLDAMVSNYSSGDLSLYMNLGDGTFEDQRVFDVSQSGSFVWFHDLDGDGDLDVSAVDELADELYIFLNRNQCYCPCHADPECDGSVDAADVLAAVAAAFRSNDPVVGADCPMARSDIDCDGAVTVHDVIWFVDEVHRGGANAPACDGCGGIQDPPCSPVVAGFGNSVLVESRTVLPGATGVEIGVYIENAVALRSIVLPLEIREVTPGAFTVGAPAFGVSGRLSGSALEDLPTAIQTLSPTAGNSCSGPVSRTWSLSSGPGGQGSPDGLLYVGLAATSGCWPAGTDGLPGSGMPSLLLTFDVDTLIGSFVIDTCCWVPENHLVFLDCTVNQCILPSFTAGTVTVACPCSCHGDPVCDGVWDVLDVVTVVGEAFRGDVPIADLPCPHVSRNDANCDCVVDVFDACRRYRLEGLAGKRISDIKLRVPVDPFTGQKHFHDSPPGLETVAAPTVVSQPAVWREVSA
ncbi:MAG: VCBS repeat-containing protein [Acidobacteria bacterium]|nr:VCBS repeat-containing protein [Acidobacteriota bacterium]